MRVNAVLFFLFACKVSPLTALGSPPNLLASPLALALYQHRWRRRILSSGILGGRQYRTGWRQRRLSEVLGERDAGGMLTWSPWMGSTHSTQAEGRKAWVRVPSQRSRLAAGVLRFAQHTSFRVLSSPGPLAPPVHRGERVKDASYRDTNRESSATNRASIDRCCGDSTPHKAPALVSFGKRSSREGVWTLESDNSWGTQDTCQGRPWVWGCALLLRQYLGPERHIFTARICIVGESPPITASPPRTRPPSRPYSERVSCIYVGTCMHLFTLGLIVGLTPK